MILIVVLFVCFALKHVFFAFLDYLQKPCMGNFTIIRTVKKIELFFHFFSLSEKGGTSSLFCNSSHTNRQLNTDIYFFFFSCKRCLI